MDAPSIQPLTLADRDWARALIRERWGAPEIVTRGRIHCAPELSGFVARIAGRPAGLVTYAIERSECEVVSLDSLRSGCGVGTRLLDAVCSAARDAGCRRVWLITTNDNVHALAFYQKRGFELVAVHRGALEESRRLKPSIPLVGLDGIPLRDEIELELALIRQ